MGRWCLAPPPHDGDYQRYQRGEDASPCLFAAEQDLGEGKAQVVHLRSPVKTLGSISAVTLPLLTAASLSKV